MDTYEKGFSRFLPSLSRWKREKISISLYYFQTLICIVSF